MKQQRKSWDFLFLVRVGEDGDVFFDRACALFWVVFTLLRLRLMNYLGCPFRHFVGVSLFDYSIRHPEKELGFSIVYLVVVDVCAVAVSRNCGTI